MPTLLPMPLVLLPAGRRGIDERFFQAVPEAYAEAQKVVNIDLAPQFIAADGVIPPTLMSDALHLSADGYRIWAKALLPVFQDRSVP